MSESVVAPISLWISFIFLLFTLPACQPPEPIFLCCYEKPVALNLPFKEVEDLFPGKLKIEQNYWGRPAAGHVYSFNEKGNWDGFEVENMLSFKFRKGRLCYFSSTNYFKASDSLQSSQFTKLIKNRFRKQLSLLNVESDLYFEKEQYIFKSDSLIYELNHRLPGYYVFQAFLPECKRADDEIDD